MEAGKAATEVKFPFADFVSPPFNHGAYNCTFSFWYNMYHKKVKDNNDAQLDVFFAKDLNMTKLFTNTVTTGPKWVYASVKLPRCPDKFNVRILSTFFKAFWAPERETFVFWSPEGVC